MSLPADSTSAPCAAELFIVSAVDRPSLILRLHSLVAQINELVKLPITVDIHRFATDVFTEFSENACHLAIVANSFEQLIKRLARVCQRLDDPKCIRIADAAGAYFVEQSLYPAGKVACLFPGEGAQYLGMLSDLEAEFPVVRQCLEASDSQAATTGLPVSRFLRFPANASAAEREAGEIELRRLSNAMFSVLLGDWAMYSLLEKMAVPISAFAGHSIGELAALWSAGCLADGAEWTPQVELVRLMEQTEFGDDKAVLLAVGASRDNVAKLVEQAIGTGMATSEVFVAMDNCPHQTVVVGLTNAMSNVEQLLRREGVIFERLPLKRPYHTPLFEPFLTPLREAFDRVEFHAPRLPLYSCTTARLFPDDPVVIRRMAVDHWHERVEFTAMIRQMYDDGYRIFVEAGPRGNLTSFVEDILRGKPSLAVAANVPHRDGKTQLLHMAAQLVSHHVPLDLRLFFSETDNQTMIAEAETDQVGITLNRDPTAAMQDYWHVMSQFLDLQQDVMQSYLYRSTIQPAEIDQQVSAPTMELETDTRADPSHGISQRPLIGEILEIEAGQRVVMQRLLDLAEDRFAADHTVGGRQISKVDPQQHGLPIGPMTFTLELMAETAELLANDQVVITIQNVRLFRWLAYDEEFPNTIQVTATAKANDDATPLSITHVFVEVHDLGNRETGNSNPILAASGTVLLSWEYPPAPLAGEFQVSNPRPSIISLQQTYEDLFHGELFQGVIEHHLIGDEGIESDIVVLPRDQLFSSTDDPQFIADPVLMDVAMHPLSAFHLEAANRAGRVMLPFELKRVDFYGPRPNVGEKLTARVWLDEQSPRHFTHSVDTIRSDGRYWSRMKAAKYWRFYFPFGDVNFHGRKDEYFVSQAWAPSPSTALLQNDLSHGPALSQFVLLKPPEDLMQATMQQVMAHVMLSHEERRIFRSIADPALQAHWIFEQLAVKDAFRLLWFMRFQERLFPSDIHVERDTDGNPVARLRDSLRTESVPKIALAAAGGIWVGLAAYADLVGLSVIRLADALTPGFEPTGPREFLSESEKRIIEPTGIVAAIDLARVVVAKRVARQVLSIAEEAPMQLVAWASNAPSVTIGVRAENRNQPLCVHTSSDRDLLFGWVIETR